MIDGGEPYALLISTQGSQQKMIEADKFLEVTFILKSPENFILVKFYQSLSIQSGLLENGLCRAIAVVQTVAAC